MMPFCQRLVALLAGFAMLLTVGAAQAARVSNIASTKHNLSSSGSGSLKSTSQSEICVFCHTPHSATIDGKAPLWNRKLSTATYTTYTSNSLDAKTIQGTLEQPGGSSKLCLSCHDGTMAIGQVNVLGGQGSATIDNMAGTGSTATGGMADGSGTTTGFTRNLGTNLENDHPISLTYTNALALRDGELRQVDSNQKWPADTGAIIGIRATGYKPKLPLEPTSTGTNGQPVGEGQIQCATCHDPHLRETNEASVGNQKFLRLNRFQEDQPDGTYSEANDIICLSCHSKGDASWAYSAHANKNVAKQVYDSEKPGVTAREFPTDQPVWKASCLNCHDTHSVQGSRRLLREGTDSTLTPKQGGASAIEETCYQCHTTSTKTVLKAGTGSLATVPNIYDDFQLLIKMPITEVNQAASTEKHDIGANTTDAPVFFTGAATFTDTCGGTTNKCGADFVETRTNLGLGALVNRHAECTDCHNPHRVVKFRDFRGVVSTPGGAVTVGITGTPDAAGTHPHTDATTYDGTKTMNHSNVASGVLRGSWGVEPVYSAASNPASFQTLPSGYTVKRGDPGTSTSSAVTEAFVTREYQICLKCHSDYGYSDNNKPQTEGVAGTGTGDRPTLTNSSGGTTSGTNRVTMYTNQAKEFQAPTAHAGEPQGATGGGAAAAYEGGTQYNHRSWHPVMAPTGRTLALRNIAIGNPWRAPWSNQVGSNTMYCTDCHGSDVPLATSVIPDGGENGKPWGPHGSNNNFLLKGKWDADTGNANSTDLCFKCHSPTIYRSESQANGGKPEEIRSGFSGSKGDNYHGVHGNRINKIIKCSWCHVAVPHGWKNKALLVNLNDLGPEVGRTAGTSTSALPYNNGPYYNNAYLRVDTFKQSGKWESSDCMGGLSNMKSVCSNPN